MALSIPDKTQIRPLDGCVTQSGFMNEDSDFGAAVYVDSAGELGEAYAGTNTAVKPRGRGIIVAGHKKTTDGTVDAGEKVTYVTFGPVAGFSGMDEGMPVYVSPSTPGGLTQTKPSGAGQQVWQMGYAQTSTILFVQPQTAEPISGA